MEKREYLRGIVIDSYIDNFPPPPIEGPKIFLLSSTSHAGARSDWAGELYCSQRICRASREGFGERGSY